MSLKAAEPDSNAAFDEDSFSPELLTAPVDGQSVTAEFSLNGVVPRHDAGARRFRSDDVFVRLESTIYGPVSRDELGALLQSGQLTGYESASSDLQHWTPLLYHPRMALTRDADPDRTHQMLHDHTTLPAASRAPRRVNLEDFSEEMPVTVVSATPLAAMVVKKARKPGSATPGTAAGQSLKLPVFRQLEPGEAEPGVGSPQAPLPPSTTAVFNVDDVFPAPPAPPIGAASREGSELPAYDGLDDFDPAAERPKSMRSVAHDLGEASSDEPLPDHDFFSANRRRSGPTHDNAIGETLPAGSLVVDGLADPFGQTVVVEAVEEEAFAAAPVAAKPENGATTIHLVVVAAVLVLVVAASLIAWMLVR